MDELRIWKTLFHDLPLSLYLPIFNLSGSQSLDDCKGGQAGITDIKENF